MVATIFVKSIDTSKESRIAKYIFHPTDKVVEGVGEDNVIQIVTDNNANFKAVRHLLWKRESTCFGPHVLHIIDLVLEDIGKQKNMKSAIKSCKSITRFIYDHTLLLALMKTFTNGRVSVHPASTRFSTHFIAMDSLV